MPSKVTNRSNARTMEENISSELSSASSLSQEISKSKPKATGRKRVAETPVTPSKRAKKSKTDLKVKEEVELKAVKAKTKGGLKKTTKFEVEETEEVVEEEGDKVKVKKVTRKRKTKEEKEAEAMPLAARTVGSNLYIGAHVSSAGGVHNTIINALHIGGNALAMFLKSQRKWENPPLKDEHMSLYHQHCSNHNYDSTQHVVPHGSYLVNLAHIGKERTAQAYKSFLDDLKRCESLGIKLYNFHPGNSAESSREEAISHLAKQLNRAHKETQSGPSAVVTLLETMATGGNIIGTTFEELAAIIDQVEAKDRIGVCLDTCHIFAAGYDLRTPEAFQATIKQFDTIIGLKYLRAFHINDSKAPFKSNKDLHANIGTGFLGLRAFHNIMNETRLHGIPMVLETPISVTNAEGKKVEDESIWAREIKLLESLEGMDVESDEFKKLEKELQEKGEKERARVDDMVKRRDEKKAKEATKGTKGAKGAKVAKGTNGKAKKKKAKEDSDEASSPGTSTALSDGD
ncbi:AP endonuclease [Patellaria atrata CBS 101060]|uniref:Apurinic-apyrimidinic endonuclease 1 n=1 Tax=Patellaria atrata CBS 101060 TaxID=1346257 RepID=A0A9P4VNW0_9PEZI|nr:AP endonuclease [Patellaria atrata CBS 101060]